MNDVARESVGVGALPLAPESPLSLRKRAWALRNFHIGYEQLRDAGGPVTRVTLGPRWLFPPVVVVTSPQGGRDMLGRTDTLLDKGDLYDEVRRLVGSNLLDLAHNPWLPRRRSLQPLFTKHHVREYGSDMAHAAGAICDSWPDGGQIALDTQCHLLTLKVLGRSVFGLDLDAHNDDVARALRIISAYLVNRALRPFLRAPSWLPTPARRRARNASARLHDLAQGIVTACRQDDRDAPLVRALMAARDPDTGRSLQDSEICDELAAFVFVGSDTTATAMTYALWQLGRHPLLQDRVRAEVHALGADPTPEDVPRLTYTAQVVQEALRLCPPAAIIPRTVMCDIDIGGYRVEAGDMVSFGIWAVQRDPALWSDPLVFDPDRFSPEKAKQLDRWQYLPFGAGPRSCIGNHFAVLEATLALATIIGRCRIESLRDGFPVAVPLNTVAAEPIPALVTKWDNGVNPGGLRR